MSLSNKLPGADRRLTNLTNALYIDEFDNVVVRTFATGQAVTVTGNVNVDKIRVWDGTNNLTLDMPDNDGEAGQWSIPVENYNYVYNGTTWDRMRGDITNGILAKITNFPATQTVTGTVNIGTIPEVEVKNDSGNPLSISRNTSANSTTNRLYVSMETDAVVADSNYEMNVARGLVTGQYYEMKNGYAPSMDSTSEGTVWGLNTAYPWSAWTGTGSRLWVGSSNAADVGQTVYIDGLDSNFARINETVTLNGTSYVQTTATFYRINRMYQLTGTATAGNVSARVTSSTGTQVGYMLAGNARQKSGFFTIPAGYTAYILYGDASSYKNGSGNVSGQVDMFTRTNDGVTRPFQNQFAAVVANGQYRNEFNVPLAIPQKTDIDVRFLPSGNATTVSVNWEMILIPN